MLKSKYRAILQKYLPEESVDVIVDLVFKYNIKLTITKGRNTKFGDYRPPHSTNGHRISINYNLNKYAFLITLVHEIAHLINWEKYQNKVKPHGNEWKNEFFILIKDFLNETIFPPDILSALKHYFINPKASSSSDLLLMKTLISYDIATEGVFVEDIPLDALFIFRGGRIFKKGEQIRKRYRCTEVKTAKVYLFNPLALVEPLD